jgi:hypothetical protein
MIACGFVGAQVATKIGVVDIPQWYDAGSVWVKNNPGFPFGARPLDDNLK